MDGGLKFVKNSVFWKDSNCVLNNSFIDYLHMDKVNITPLNNKYNNCVHFGQLCTKDQQLLFQCPDSTHSFRLNFLLVLLQPLPCRFFFPVTRILNDLV